MVLDTLCHSVDRVANPKSLQTCGVSRFKFLREDMGELSHPTRFMCHHPPHVVGEIVALHRDHLRLKPGTSKDIAKRLGRVVKIVCLLPVKWAKSYDRIG